MYGYVNGYTSRFHLFNDILDARAHATAAGLTSVTIRQVVDERPAGTPARRRAARPAEVTGMGEFLAMGQ